MASAKRRRQRYAEDPEYRARELARRKPYIAARSGRRRTDHLQSRYGISVAQYDAMFARQGGRCKICKKTSTRRLCTDHSHATGQVRGLLCLKCNFMLGFGDDDPERFKAAIAYLRAALEPTTRRPTPFGADRNRKT